MSSAPPKPERRRTDRRSTVRATTRPSQESWFGALGEDSQSREGWAEEESRYDGNWQAAQAAQADSNFLTRQARRLIGSGQTAFQRIYGAFISARAALGVALVATLVVAAIFGVRPAWPVVAVSVAYAALALSMWVLPRYRRTAAPRQLARLRSPQWISTIGVDIVCFGALHWMSPASGLNYVALLVLPVLMAGVLTPRLMALATASVVTLALLGVAWLSVLAGGVDVTALMTQAGLAGSGFFVITLLAGELAGRLAREELTARGSLELARQQAQLNRLVIEEMQEGVLVVDRRGRVRTANPAARALLAPSGVSREAPFQLQGVEAWTALVKSVERAFAESTWPEGGRDVLLDFDSAPPRTLRVRVRFTRRQAPDPSEELCVLFIEDVRSMQARTRQEKLAAMGRVSAGIAHEIRNPLAAISQANALLSEDVTTPGQRQLTQMVTENVSRLKRIVDDVMEVAPGEVQDGGPIDATALVAAVCSEWARTAGMPIGGDSLLRVRLPEEALGVVFDPEHLRRVMVNLLDNAKRHAQQTPGGVRLTLSARDEVHVVLSVTSNGEPIPPEVERYLFEPFFSTRSRGTGLGLYICRELCERYGARIDYRLRAASEPNRNEFFVAMRRKPLAGIEAPENRLHLTS
ncbi:PAS domain-containing sensor histidine kinase [Rhizobacter sp. OV335]|uniref:sensor histidine kinase n=1 Tax=Rhizobacter sp. OV335 TaxID=1500264 RepID=UPI000912F4A1|nr:ATP-binding protein [Rhizobacter sp. OV335]SHM24745.1 two-component system, NtrC family, sensor histidine kinase PilS [Rhizobacter sp. OV335]